jgi:hypothetical protein
MKLFSAYALAAVMLTGLPNQASAAACNGTWADRPAADGTMKRVCLDGRMSSCLRDGVNVLKRDSQQVRAFCDNLKAQGKLR